MIVKIKCFTGMRRFAPDGRHEFDIELEAGALVVNLLDQLKVPSETEAIAAVNGLRAKRNTRLQDGDTVVLFTPMEGG